MMNNTVLATSTFNDSHRSDQHTRSQTVSYFILAILGFSFWFFMAVPFASHRETYWWLAMVHSHNLAQAFARGISSTYRPLAQATTWLAFRVLDPTIFPTSILRQAIFQGFMYGMFIVSWWLIYAAAAQRRLFALIAFITGGVFFSGYVHLFHIYGLFYVPVMLTLGVLLSSHASHSIEKRELWFGVLAILLIFWHPFATALFLGFYFGFYVETCQTRSRAQHVQAILIIFLSTMAIAALVVLFPRTKMPLDTRLFGFLVSYRTSEINGVASLVAFLATLMTVFSMRLSPRLTAAATLFVSALSFLLISKDLPLLLLWLCAALVKLFRLRCWSLFLLTLTAALLPFGGAIGTPVYTLFATITAIYVTQLGWSGPEKALSFLTPRYPVGAGVVLAVVLTLVRIGIDVPLVTRAAGPLLRERERTYQLETALTWLHNSDYCGYEIGFVDNAGSPIESVENVITRRNRPPAALEDVTVFWKTLLQCPRPEHSGQQTATAIITFGGPALPNLKPVFDVKGKYAGYATVWVPDSQMRTACSR